MVPNMMKNHWWEIKCSTAIVFHIYDILSAIILFKSANVIINTFLENIFVNHLMNLKFIKDRKKSPELKV